MDYTNLQVFGGEIEFGTNQEVGFDLNAGKASIKGFEAELSVLATENIELRASVSHVDSGIEELDGETFDPILRLPGVRPWTATANAIYNKQINDAVSVFARLDYVYQHDTYDELEHEPLTYVSSINTLDLSVGFGTDDWTVTAYMDNVFDDKYWTAFFGSFQPQAAFEPRMYGFRFTYNWGE